MLDKAGAKRLAISAHDGFARALWPAHTPFDGDLVFALATGGTGKAPAGVDLVDGRDDLAAKLAHRWPGFTDDAVRARLRDAGLRPSHPISVPGALEVRLWPALLPLPAPSPPAHAPHLATEDA